MRITGAERDIELKETKMRTHDWTKLRRAEFEELASRRALVITPLGTIEQHGLHPPVDVDIKSAQTLSLMVAERFTHLPVIVAPPLMIGCSTSFIPCTRTISLPMETVMRLVSEVCRCIRSHGFRRILVVNGNLGHAEPLNSMNEELAGEAITMRPVTYWQLVAQAMVDCFDVDKANIGHAGEIETSLQLHFQPEHVERSRAVTVEGVGGDLAPTTADKGRRFANAVEDALLGELETLATVG